MAKKKSKKPGANQVQYAGVEKNHYGFEIDASTNQLEVERAMFLRGGSDRFASGKANPKGKSKSFHFWRIVDLLWHYKGSRVRVDAHPLATRMVDALCEHDWLSIAGCSNSGKSMTLAVWGIVNFLMMPSCTQVVVTSTSLKDSKKRIWGDIEKLWRALPGSAPGTLVSSQGFIRYVDPVSGDQNDKFGISLVAGEKSKESDSLAKLVGFKADRMFLIADELPELSETLVDAAEANLSSNPYFQFVGIGNPNTYYDPHGILSEPKDGWASITEKDYEWEGKKAYVIRFDAEKSPNFDYDEPRWEYLMTREKLEEKRRQLGEKSLKYYRFVKGFWFSETGTDCIYSALMLQLNKAHDKAVFKGRPRAVAGLDPAFTHGGDDCPLTIGHVGEEIGGKRVIERVHTYFLNEDATNRTKTRSQQIAEQVVALCVEHGVDPHDLNVDSTGGGKSFCDVLAMVWGTDEFRRVEFGSKAQNPDEYYNRVSELWFEGQPLVRNGQLRGIDTALAKEMTSREYHTINRKIRIQSKTDYKKVIGKSPDNADSYFLMLDIAKKKGRVKAGKTGGSKGIKRMRKLAALWD